MKRILVIVMAISVAGMGIAKASTTLPAAPLQPCDAIDLLVTSAAAPPSTSYQWHLTAMTVSQADTTARVLVLGDSIAAGFPTRLLSPLFGNQRVADLGVGGFRIQNVLWLLDRDGRHGFKPDNILLIIGTNNLIVGDKSCAIASGIKLILQKIRTAWPDAAVYILAITPHAPGHLFREVNRRDANERLAQFQGMGGVYPFSADAYLEEDPNAFKPDFIHLTPSGYADVLAALCELVRHR
jgi:lysophospholipase L1-like esterase